MRFDATMTPTITTTPQEPEQVESEKNIQERPEATELETRLHMLSPTPTTTPVPTPTNTEKILPEKATPIVPSPTPSPLPTPLPETPGAKSKKGKKKGSQGRRGDEDGVRIRKARRDIDLSLDDDTDEY